MGWAKVSGSNEFCVYISEKHLSDDDVLQLIHDYLKVFDCVTVRIKRASERSGKPSPRGEGVGGVFFG
jgi:hypothetical protein